MAGELNSIIYLLFQALFYLLFARVILSWIPVAPGDALYDITIWVYNITDPLCLPFQRLIPPIGGFDFSIIFVFVLLEMFQQFIFKFIGG